MMITKRNERSIRSIREAFLELLDDLPYNKITVTDIVEHADVSRQTFYNFFKTKDDLALSFLDENFDEFFDHIENYLAADVIDFTYINTQIYKQFVKSKPEISKIINLGIDQKIYERFRRYNNRILGNIIRQHDIEVKDALLMTYVVEFSSGATFQMILKWIRDGMPYTPEFMGHLHTGMTQVKSFGLPNENGLVGHKMFTAPKTQMSEQMSVSNAI